MNNSDIIKMLALLLFMQVELVIALPEYFMEEHCSQTLALNYGSVEAVRLRLSKAETYPNGAQCAMRIQAPEGKRLLLKIEHFDIQGSAETQCNSGDYIAILDGQNEQSMPLSGLPRRVCERPDVRELVSSDRFIVLQFSSDDDEVVGKGMSVLITAFNEGRCTDSQFKCKSSGRCIQKRLECDGTPSCIDGSDEGLPKCLSTAAIVGIGIGGAAVLIAIIVITAVLIVGYIRRRRARTIRRAMSSNESPDTFWYAAHHMESVRNQLAASKVDPIWDGDKDTDHITDKDDEEITERPKRRTMSVVVGPCGENMKKVPSGYWDIPVTEIYEYGEDEHTTDEGSSWWSNSENTELLTDSVTKNTVK